MTFCVSLFVSCTSNIELPPPPESLNSSGNSSSSHDGYSSSYSDDSSSSFNTSSSSSSNVSSESQVPPQFDGDEFIDPRDGKRYKYEITSNGRVWLSENLNFSRNNTLGYCYGENINGENPHRDASGCDSPYGRNYEWSVAMDGKSPQGLCPNGWHIPSNAEWSQSSGQVSIDFYIRSGNYNMNPEWPPVNTWKERGTNGFYWTSNGNNYFVIFTGGSSMEIQNTASSLDYFSVRCVMDEGGKLPCGSSPYNPINEFCYNNTTVHGKCDGKTYNPNLYQCEANILTCLPALPSGYYCLENSIYQEIIVDGKTWMTSNLENDATYDWAAAMGLPSSCNSSDCTTQINSQHKGVCPVGWHIPKSDEITTNTFFNSSDTWWTATQEVSYESNYAYYKNLGGGVTYSYKTNPRSVRCVKN